MVHTAEDLCEFVLERQGIGPHLYEHADVRHGFILSFVTEPEIDFDALEAGVNELINEDISVSYYDETHIMFGEDIHRCTGPRMHVRSAGEIGKVTFLRELLREPITDLYLLVGVVGEITDLNDLHNIVLS
jgi:hypothetical protein